MNREIIKLIKQRLDVFDGRDWEEEALEEILDSLVYIAAALLKKRKSDSKLINILSEKKGIQQDTEC